MDSLIDQFAAAAPSSEKSEKERIEAVLSHPLFMSNLGEFGGDGSEELQQENKETINAIQSLVFDGTPKEMAENFKHQGNACFKEGPRKYQNSIKFYTQGIECKVDNELLLNSALHSNRAAVHLELCNYRSVLYDCGRAISFNPQNVKAYFRSAKALFALERVEECLDCCKRGLAVDPSNNAFREIAKKANVLGERLAELARLSAIKEKAKIEEATKFNAALQSRKYKMKTLDPENEDENEEIKSLQHPEADLYRIHLFPEGEMSFPVLFLYPEFSQSDVISSFRENDTFYSHFELMFEQAAPWDQAQLYHPQTLDWYFETYTGKYDKKGRELVSCLKNVNAANARSQGAAHRYACMTLADVLRHPQHTIVNGVVRIMIFSRSSTTFAANYRKDFQRLRQ